MLFSAQMLGGRPAITIGLIALFLAGCSSAPTADHSAQVQTTPVDTPEPQNLQEKPVDFRAPASESNVQSLDAQGDIGRLLNQIHSEQEAHKP